MQVTLSLPETLVNHLQQQAEQLDVSLDDLTAKLLSDALINEQTESLSAPDDEVDLPTLEELVARIRATPPNPKAVHPPTKTVEEVLAALEASPSPESDITPEEWDRMWAAFEQELKAVDRAKDIEEGRL